MQIDHSVLIALLTLGWLLTATLAWRWRPRQRKAEPLPVEWALSPRPVFSADERRLYRLLREALPHHVLLAKLPLVRLCQPSDPAQVSYWYGLLGSAHVTFAICSSNGRVLAAIDFEQERTRSRRVERIKRSVLAACRVRYLRCPIDHLPSAAELQLLVPHALGTPSAPQPASTRNKGGRGGRPHSGPVAAPSETRRPLWQDSAFFQDSFFGIDQGTELSGDTDDGSAPPSDDAAASDARLRSGPRPPPHRSNDE